ncbi:angiogenic factor with G patch and FHA domains 1 [Megalops cyprinoides]|uniref:angiogenic factor with G patch and FHA domains 1 n=1 Tax=Megalops cyprinoides TaxID=118141 RepID=UPI001864B7CA|nr:angiogenic factor with G patch and FHA domains 1 [Megalops cyprinoides]
MATHGDEDSESEVVGLKLKVETLKQKLKTCKSEIHKLQKQLSRTERLQKNTERYYDDLQKQVYQLNAELHEQKGEKNRTDTGTQTEDYTWGYYNYYYGGYYQSGAEATETEETASEEHRNHASEEPSHTANGSVTDNSGTQENHKDSSEPKETDGTSIAEMLRATAEEAVSQTGFVFDETSGMYYDHSTGFYYDSTSQLYYDANTGMYYYFDVETGCYQFHSRVELPAYQATPESSQDKKSKKKRKGTEKSALQEDKDHRAAEGDLDGKKSHQKRKRTPVSHRERRSCSPERRSRSPKRRSHSSSALEDGELAMAEDHKKAKRGSRANHTARKKALSDDASSGSELEEGEITDSQGEEDTSSESSTTDSSKSESDDQEVSEEAWPPCVRVTVVRSPVLQTGNLYILTADKPATIGREKDMDHAIRIPEVGVSKFHAEVYFDQCLQCYVLVDQGSQNGTVINGNRILQPKVKSEPFALTHGDEIKMGETVLSFHIHSGNNTCDGCEPGQVIAHLSRRRKEESGGQVISKEDKEVKRQKELKQMKVKYGLKNSEYEGSKALKNSKYTDRAEKRRQVVGSEGTFCRDDAPASVDVEISDSNKGRKMLEKMGWNKGEGLGKGGAGRKEPIQLKIRKSHAGLGAATAMSVDDAGLARTKNQENWEKARERFAETCQTPNASSKKEKDVPKSWVKSNVDESSK